MTPFVLRPSTFGTVRLLTLCICCFVPLATRTNADTGARTVHHGHMPEIDILDASSARGTWAMFDYVEWSDGSESTERVGSQGYGHYVEEYVNEDGQWRIARSRLERLRVDPLGAGLPDAPGAPDVSA